jgi:two-component system chemotaxis response regulator CheB
VTFRALELGAVDFVTKPRLNEQTPDDYGQMIADKIRAAKTARLKAPRRAGPEDTQTLPAAIVKRPVPVGVKTSERVIVVGASTGGTEAIREFLVGMPQDCPGIVIVQHMPENFTRMFAERLNGLCQITVKEAEHNDPILPGHAYIAPGGKHLWLKRDGGQLLGKLSTEPPMNLHRPSVDFLFLSAAKFLGADAVGVIMTGMGKDGAAGMLKMKEAGAWTIAQDEATSVIFGMPREAIELGAVHEVAPLGRLCEKALARGVAREPTR